MNESKPPATQLAEILELPPGATDGDITSRATLWATERKRQRDNVAFEQRVAALVRVTNMPREEAVKCLAEQDKAARGDGLSEQTKRVKRKTKV
jgi:hypothetical protein